MRNTIEKRLAGAKGLADSALGLFEQLATNLEQSAAAAEQVQEDAQAEVNRHAKVALDAGIHADLSRSVAAKIRGLLK